MGTGARGSDRDRPRVDGNTPSELHGAYLRTGPNPASGRSDHWSFGDGMVHGIRLANGKAGWYRNRFVQTPNIPDPMDDPMAGMGDLTRGTGNTYVVAHNGEILCLQEGQRRLPRGRQTLALDDRPQQTNGHRTADRRPPR